MQKSCVGKHSRPRSDTELDPHCLQHLDILDCLTEDVLAPEGVGGDKRQKKNIYIYNKI